MITDRNNRTRTMLSVIMIMLLFAGMTVVSAAEEKTLRIATTNEVKTPALIGDYAVGLFNHLTNPPLMQMNSDGKLVGLLAEKYEVSSDNKDWTFYVKDNQFWSDGKPVTGDDIAFSIQMYANNVPSSKWIKDTLTDTVVDGNKVTLKFNKPYTTIPLEFTSYSIVPKHVWEKIDNPNEYTNPGPYVGAGPFYIDSIDINAGKMILKKNPSWKGQQPYYDTVEISWFKNADAASKALESGKMDTYWTYSSSYPYSSIESLEKTGNFDTLEKSTSGLAFMGFNLNKTPMSDKAFREAVSYALDYQELTDIATLGHGKSPNSGFVPPAMDGYVSTRELKQDTAKAKELLAKAGYKDSDGNGIVEGQDGKDLKVNLLIRSSFSREAELIKEYMEKAGIGVEIKSVEDNTWMDMKDKGDYDITLTRTTPWGMLMHAGWATGYFDGRRSGQGVLHTVNDQKFLDLADKILATSDQNERATDAKEVQEYYAENLPGIPLYWKNDVTPYNKKITGWYSNPLYGIMNEYTFTGIKPVA